MNDKYHTGKFMFEKKDYADYDLATVSQVKHYSL